MTEHGQARILQDVDRWFIRHGLPQFATAYLGASIRDALPVLIILASAALTALPWLSFGADNVLTDAIPLAAFGIWLVPLVRWMLGDAPRVDPRHVAWWLLALLPIAWALLASRLPPPLETSWTDFAFTVVVLATAARLAASDVRSSPTRASGTGVALVVLLMLMVLVTAAEGTSLWPVTDAREPGRTLGGLIDYWRGDVPDALSMAPVALLCFVLAVRATSPSRRPLGTGRARVLAPFVRVTPWLALLWTLQVVFLPYVRQISVLSEAVAPPLVALLLLGWAWRRRQGESPPALRPRALLAALVCTIFGHILLVANIEIEGSIVRDTVVLDVVLGVIAVFVIIAGLDRLLVWAGIEAVSRFGAIVIALVRGLPVLLIFVGFLGLVEEVWRIAAREPTETFALIAGTLLAVTAGYLALDADQEVRRLSTFASWDGVRELLRDDPGVPAALMAGVPTSGAPENSERLSAPERLNAVAVILAYDLLILVPVALCAFGIFIGLGRLVVVPELFYDTDQLAAAKKAWTSGSTWAQPWTEVALLMAAFSVLYLAIHITGREQRGDFLAAPQRTIRLAFAVRAASRRGRRSAAAPTPLDQAVRPTISPSR